jgi:hypothetical protein
MRPGIFAMLVQIGTMRQSLDQEVEIIESKAQLLRVRAYVCHARRLAQNDRKTSLYNDSPYHILVRADLLLQALSR